MAEQDRFARDTAVQPLGPGRYRGRVDPGWSVVDDAAPNGGYLLAIGSPAGRGEMGGYVRFSDADDDTAMDTLGLLIVADCFAPAVFNLGDVTARWVPTIELTVQIRARPAPGYLAARFTTQAITDGYLEEDGQIWDAGGHLVALSRQLALMPR